MSDALNITVVPRTVLSKRLEFKQVKSQRLEVKSSKKLTMYRHLSVLKAEASTF